MRTKRLPTLTPEEATRFWECVDRRASNECWNWVAGLSGNGYGEFNLRGKYYSTHRIAYFLGTGNQATGKCVCHRCDNRTCCNPRHLFAGTIAVNNSDMIRKGRARKACGEKASKAKLTEAEVLLIRSAPRHYGFISELARRFNVSHPAVADILYHKTWRHVL